MIPIAIWRLLPSDSGRTFKHVLVPVWLLQYNYGTKSYQVIANGYTGAIAGRRPYSAWKIAFAILLASDCRARSDLGEHPVAADLARAGPANAAG